LPAVQLTGVTQEPLTQALPLEQVVPQAPQLLLSVLVLTQLPLQ
jgi:hypothetical protein